MQIRKNGMEGRKKCRHHSPLETKAFPRIKKSNYIFVDIFYILHALALIFSF